MDTGIMGGLEFILICAAVPALAMVMGIVLHWIAPDYTGR